MNVLDLFAGLRGWSKPAEMRGHRVVSIDFDPQFDVTYHLDLSRPADVVARLYLDGFHPDLILASPPCEGFTVMNIGKNWYHDGRPKTPTAWHALELVSRTLELIETLAPAYWVLENPRGKLRALAVMKPYERRTVTYCQLGEQRMKPTDLWGAFPPSLVLPDPCRNGDSCHVSAPRGSRTPGSTQGITGGPSRAEIPKQLASLVIEAAERDLATGRKPERTMLWG